MPVEAGAANTMVTAVLESAGYYYQTVVLDDLTPAFKGSLGALTFVIGLAMAIIGVAIRGSYKFAAWLLIGPPLFFSAVLPRSDVGNARWKYANQNRPQAWVDREVTRVIEAGSGSYNVSTLFARYNEIVSQSVQEIVKVINQGNTDSDRSFILKGQLVSMLMSRQVQNPFLKQLMSQALFGQCSQVVNAAKELLDPNLDNDVRQRARKVFQDGYFSRNRTLSPDAARALLTEAGPEMAKQLEKIIGHPFTCEEIWNFTKQLLEQDSREGLDKIIRFGRANLIKSETIIRKLLMFVDSKGQIANYATAGAASDLDKLVKASMKRSLMLGEQDTSFAGMIADARNRGNDVDLLDVNREPTLSETENARGRSTEWAEKTRMLTAAGNLPYYQGLLLFFLALAYPFFAILLLIPGKHAGFLLWFVLWLWVKCWDIGMALVIQLDNILFSMFSYARELYPTGPNSNAFEENFIRAMWMLRQADPSFQLSTYYNIIACCLLAIPVVLSQFIVGSLSGGAGVVAQGIRATADTFSGSTRAAQAQFAVSAIRQDMLQLASDRALSNYERLKRGNGGQVFDKVSAYSKRNDYELKHGLPANSRIFNENASGAAGSRRGPASEFHFKLSGQGDDLTRRAEGLATLRNWAGILQGVAGERAGVTLYSPSPKVPGMKDKDFDETPMLGALGGLFKSGAKIASDLLTTIADTEEKVLPDLIKTQAEWEVYDTFYSDEGRRLAAEARVYGMLEVPWTANTGEFKELEYERMLWTVHKDLERSYTAAMFDGASAITGFYSNTFQSDAAKNYQRSNAANRQRPGAP